MTYTILHISDLHFNSGESSYLTRTPELFIHELVEEIKSVENHIDYLFITGDFVHIGGWSNYEVIKGFINQLESELEIKNTFTTIGNHDIIKSNNSIDNYLELKNSMRRLVPIVECDLFASYYLNNEWLIEFNCFANGYDFDLKKSKVLTDNQIDFFAKFVGENLNHSDSIFILSHLPIEVNPESRIINEEKDWKSKHIWDDGRNLLNIIRDKCNPKLLICFAGDGHVVENYKLSGVNEYYFLTGRFNGPNEGDKAKEASCQILRVDTVQNSIKRQILLSTFQQSFSLDSVKWYSKNQNVFSNKKDLSVLFDVPAQKVLKDLIEKSVESSQLYRLTKATTKKSNVTIGWIDVNGLLNSENVVKKFLEVSLELLSNEFKENFEKIIFVGLGQWGASLACLMGASTNIGILIIKDRGCKLNNEDFDNLTEGKEIVLVTDVVASGETLNDFMKAFQLRRISCLVCLVLNNFIKDKINNVDKIIYGTDKISLPVIPLANLPESVCKSEFDFR